MKKMQLKHKHKNKQRKPINIEKTCKHQALTCTDENGCMFRLPHNGPCTFKSMHRLRHFGYDSRFDALISF